MHVVVVIIGLHTAPLLFGLLPFAFSLYNTAPCRLCLLLFGFLRFHSLSGAGCSSLQARWWHALFPRDLGDVPWLPVS
jgi:hypothetical protein